MRTALDTSVIVSSLLKWHEAHSRAAAAVARARKDEPRLVIPVTALVQALSVMTRMPTGYRVPAAEALLRLRSEFGAVADLVAHEGNAAWKFLDRAVANGVSGGGIHDADILACAERAGATRLLTLNPADFERLGPTKVEIVVP